MTGTILGGDAAPAAGAEPGTTPAAGAEPGTTPAAGAEPGTTPAAGAEPGAAKGGEPDKGAAVPEKYDLKLSEGSLFGADAVEEIGAFARELGLPQDAAQKLVARDEKLLSSFVDHIEEARSAAHAEQVKAWADAVKSDKEIGGEKYTETMFLADKAMRQFATPELKKALTETGLGNHPELVKLFMRVGKSLAEDSPGGPPAGGGGEKDVAKVLYPSMN